MMQVIVSGRGEGKTTKLIELSAETGCYIVCHSRREAHRIMEIARGRNLKIHLPITHRGFLAQKYLGRGIAGFLIDNVDLLVQGISTVPVKAVTLTSGEIAEEEFKGLGCIINTGYLDAGEQRPPSSPWEVAVRISRTGMAEEEA